MSFSISRFRSISSFEFASIFAVFGVMLSAALLLPERSDGILLHRVINTIWVSTLLLIPALCLYALPQCAERQTHYALLLFTASYAAYMVHFYLATFWVFGGICGIFTHMRPPIAILNVVVTLWWTFDVILAWFGPVARWARREHVVFYVFLYAVFVYTEIELRPAMRYPGLILGIAVPFCLAIRWSNGWGAKSQASRATDAPGTESPGIAKARLLYTFVTFVALMIAAHAAAEIKGALDARTVAAHHGFPAHSVVYYRAVFTIWSSLLLLTPALVAYVAARPGTTNSYWKGFWTFAFLALLVHLYWTIGVMFEWDIHQVFHNATGEGKNPEKIVDHPGPDLFLTAWWALDVLLAWICARPGRWVRFERGAVHLLAFLMYFGAFVLVMKASTAAHLLGVVAALLVSGAFVFRVLRYESDPNSFLMRNYISFFRAVNLFLTWYRLPTPLAIANLGVLRDVLRANNLHDTSAIPITRREGERAAPTYSAKFLSEREPDGYYNSLDKKDMGCSSLNPNDETFSSDFTLGARGARFGRNIPLGEVGPLPTEKLTEPNPRLISNLLLARTGSDFQKATSLNLLAAAWIQFQTHDWFNHGTPVSANPLRVTLPPGDNWVENPMRIRYTRPDPTRHDPNQPYPEDGPADGYVATYANAETHWWDGSEVYGSSLFASKSLRTNPDSKPDGPQDGKLNVLADQNLPEVDQLEQTGLTVNWWLGLSLLHDLFTREHNAICDRLKQAYPSWTNDQYYRVARLANTALIAKIHTVDWTPAILAHPALEIGMRANWWGLLTENVKKSLGRLSESEAFSGIAGSRTDQTGADYCLTEEFVSVYRMHPLLPNDIELRSASDGHLLKVLKLGSEIDNDPDDVVGPGARDRALKFGTLRDCLYSFGVCSPGALVLRNFPNWMRRLRRFKGQKVEELIDLATIDIVRDRERGVPRYNRFRRLFHLPEFGSLDEMIQASRQLSADPELAEAVRRVYNNDINQVDLMVGMYAETPPEGFGFSDTAFRVFILMASRRIKSDRFLTDDYTPEVYTQVGLDWVENSNMASVLNRHYPELATALRNVANPFAPWQSISG